MIQPVAPSAASIRILLCWLPLLFGCSIQIPVDDGVLTIMSYNVQTLFDDRSDGNEFDGFDPAVDDWNSRPYHLRLERLSRVIRESVPGGPDIVVLQEIENRGVLEDLVRYFLSDMGYRFGESASAPGQPLSIAVLSKVEPDRFLVHGVRHGDTRLRPVLELGFDAGSPFRACTLLAVHWKSKAGSDTSEELRLAGSGVVSRLAADLAADDPDRLIIVAGDTNEDIDEYALNGSSFLTALMPADTGIDQPPLSPALYVLPSGEASDKPDSFNPDEAAPVFIHYWDQSDGGSYLFRKRWERIDQILLTRGSDGGSTLPARFRVMDSPFLRYSDGSPRRFRLNGASGFSDHLPVILELTLH